MSMRLRYTLLMTCVLAWGTLPVLGSSEGEGSTNLFAGDIGNAIWTLVIFGGVLFVLGKWVWGPVILKGLQGRERFIHDSLAKAKADREESEARLKELTDRLHHAREEASAIVEEGRRDADVVRRQIEADARTEADRIIERARREIEIAKDTAIKELYDLAGGLVTEVASRVVRKELSGADHERLISESIDEFRRVRAN
jgi:F-type H+-transporting ATPase subunit b